MTATRRPSSLALAAALALGGAAAVAQTAYPSRPVKWVIPSPAGSPIDAVGRKLGELASARIGAPVVIDNKPGGAGTIGAGEVARAKPDGYTLLLSVGDPLISAVATMKIPYKPERDFKLISKIAASGPVLIASKAVKANTLTELVRDAKASAEPLTYGSYGPGSYPQLIMETMGKQASIKFTEVPYKGSPPALTDLMGGTLALSFTSTNIAAPLIADGKVKAIAVIGDQRSPLLPQVQTFAEAGYKSFVFHNKVWVGLAGPAALPDEVLQKLSAAVQQSVRDPAFGQYLQNIGFDAVGNSPSEFLSEYREEFSVVPKLIKELGVVVQ